MGARSSDSASDALSPALQAAIAARAEPDGFVPLDRYFDVALYGDGVGYYRREATPFGPSGDFYTAARVQPLYARTLARRFAAVRAALGRSAPLAILDLGAGDGTLLRGLVAALAERGAAGGIEAVIVDRSPARREAATAAVAPVASAAGVPLTATASLAEHGPWSAIVVAHEVLDAQPTRQLRWDGARWTERGVRLRDGRLLPAEAPLPPGAAPRGLPALGAEDAGSVVEVSAAAEAIVREVADHLVAGELLVVDYGAEERDLRAAHPDGTVAAVRAHRALASPWEAPGGSDLSAFVNFSRIRAAAARAGLVEVGWRSQAEALSDWGLSEELDRAVAAARGAEEAVRLRLAAKNLLFGFGTFRVLELAARASAPALNGAATVPSGSGTS